MLCQIKVAFILIISLSSLGFLYSFSPNNSVLLSSSSSSLSSSSLSSSRARPRTTKRTAIVTSIKLQRQASQEDGDVQQHDSNDYLLLDRRIFFNRLIIPVAAVTASSIPLPTTTANAIGDVNEIEEINISNAVQPSNKNNRNSNKPYAPSEALLPAIRVQLTIEEAIQLVNEIIKNNTSPKTAATTKDTESKLIKLETLLLKEQNYIKSFQTQGVPKTPAKQYLESYKPMSGDLPFQRFLIKNGDISTWKDLKKQEKAQEKQNEIRAALNAYTDVLSFSGDSYLLNVDKETKSNMIRGDTLPELKQVITSDMGLRYLYRNQILTSMDDVKSELQYQLSLLNSINDEDDKFELDELLNLLMEAKGAFGRWLSLIDQTDVEEATTIVTNEKERTD